MSKTPAQNVLCGGFMLYSYVFRNDEGVASEKVTVTVKSVALCSSLLKLIGNFLLLFADKVIFENGYD